MVYLMTSYMVRVCSLDAKCARVCLPVSAHCHGCLRHTSQYQTSTYEYRTADSTDNSCTPLSLDL